MSSFLFRKRTSRCWVVLCRYPKPETQLVPSLLFSTLREPQPRNLNKPQNATISIESHRILEPGPCSFSPKTSKTLLGSLQNVKNSIASGKSSGFSSNLGLPMVKSLCGFHGDPSRCSLVRLFGTRAAQEPSTSDGLTVDRILNSEWPILTEDESDWKSHAAAIAQSIHLIKKRLQVQLKNGLLLLSFCNFLVSFGLIGTLCWNEFKLSNCCYNLY